MSAKRVLLIDDEKYLSEVIQLCLEKLAGWTVFTAESGIEGLRLAEVQQPDAILLDVMMPDLDGFLVLQHLKHNPMTQSIPVLLLTAKTQAVGESNADIVGVLTKPFDPLNLVDQINQALGWSRST